MILISAGHYPGAVGACDGDFCEHPEATLWMYEIVKRLKQTRQASAVPVGKLGYKVTWINAINPLPELAVEIHFNSDVTKKQKGSETLHCPGSVRGKHAAEIVQLALAGLFPPSRGVKEGWYKMDKPGHKDYAGDVEGDEVVDYFLKTVVCPALIIEPEFIYNKDVILGARQNAWDALAVVIAEAADRIKG